MKEYSNITKRFLLATKSAEISELEQLSINCKVVAAVADMIHQLQRERGSSNIFLSSRSTLFSQQLETQVILSQVQEERLRTILKSLFLSHDYNKMRLLHNITLTLQGLDDLPTLRAKVNHLSISSRESTQAYSRLVTSLMSVIFEAADVANEPRITALLVSLFNLIQGKEFAGQERAWAAIGFAETHFDVMLCQRLQELQNMQAQTVEVFLKFSCPEARRQWDKLEQSHYLKELNQLRVMIQGLSDGRQIDASLSEAWFNVATNRIDQMRLIEENLTDRLNELAQEKVVEAQSQLAEHRLLIESFDEKRLPHSSPLTLLFDERMPGLYGGQLEQVSSIPKEMQGVGVKSIYDLLIGQSENIRQMNQELDDAKQALVEYKSISRAKSLLMQQNNMTEEQAHREMQKSAMDNNIKVAELAILLIQNNISE
jgi:hypothetical protein